MDNKQTIILLLANDLKGFQDIICRLSKKFTPYKIIVLSTIETKDFNNDSVEFRLLPKSTQEDFILKTIREISDIYESELICCVAEDPELSLLATLAMSLTASYKDRLCYIQTEPLSIKDIPFTRLCYLYQDRFHRLPNTYAKTVELANQRVSRHIDAPDLFLSTDPVSCTIGECELFLETDEFILFWLLASRCKNNVVPIQGEAELLDEYRAFIESTLSTVMPGICEIRTKLHERTESCMLKMVDSLTAKIKQHIALDNGLDCSLPVRDQGVYGLSFSPENVSSPRNY